jgi:glycosyltransferase involved in cell wall biosynthesis
VSTLVAAWAAFGSIVWCALMLLGLRGTFRFRTFRSFAAPDPAVWPKLSVVVPACDEEATIGPALETLVAQDYPDLEIVVVDDRSRDRTGAIADEAAARDSRVQVVHVRELPAGWLGKVHALDRGTAAARGAWILYTDADVHFAPGALRRAVAYAEALRLDHVAVAPELVTSGLAQETVSVAFATAYMIGTRADQVGRPGSKAYAGVGAFNLVRRAALDRTPGFSWLRLEVLDDVGLGLMLRNAGARAAFAIGLGDLKIAWYPSLRTMARGLRKNMFGAFCRYRVWRLVLFLLAVALIAPGPAIALFAPRSSLVFWLGILTAALLVAHAALLGGRTRRSFLAFLLMPAGAVVLVFLVVRSAWRCLLDGGVTWRGTFYPLAELRAGQRVRL